VSSLGIWARSGAEAGLVSQVASILQLCHDLLQQIHPGAGWTGVHPGVTSGMRDGGREGGRARGSPTRAPCLLPQAGDKASSHQFCTGCLQERSWSCH
jgi:hypothetical protein